MENDKVYVLTGGTSFIASGLLRKLVQERKKVYAICRPGSKNLYRIPDSDRIHLIFCDLSELYKVEKLIGEACDVFFHLGWNTVERDDMYLQNLNITYTLDAVGLAQKLGCRLFLGVGSQAEYGLVNEKMTPDTPCFPITGYGMAKLCAGQMSRKICKNIGMEHIWTRPLSIYGSMADDDTFVMFLIKKILQRESIKLTRGEQIWDFLHIDDCANALFLLSLYGKNMQIYPIGSGEAIPFRTYAQTIADVVDYGVKLKFGDLPYSYNTPMYLSADIHKLRQDTGFEPSISFPTGIKNILMEIRNK